MKNIFFDICSIPIFILILCTFIHRGMAKYRMLRLLYAMSIISLVCVVLDIAMEYVVNPVPLSGTRVVLGMLISFSYKLVRNGSMVIYLLFIFEVTRTDYRIRNRRAQMIIWAPYCVTVILLLLNFFNGWIFTVTAQEGYARGPLLWVLYLIIAIYFIEGIGYLLACRNYLETSKIIAILSVYLLTAIGILVQMLLPNLMLEMFSTAIGLLTVLLFVARPEERLDAVLGIYTWKCFQSDLRNRLFSGEPFTILMLRKRNGDESRSYLGDEVHFGHMKEIANALENFMQDRGADSDIYFERPASFYLVLDKYKVTDDIEGHFRECMDYINGSVKSEEYKETWLDPQLLMICCPKDLHDQAEIINMCHRFHLMSQQTIVRASELMNSRNFDLLNHIEEILRRVIAEEGRGLEMYYQPIYSVKEKKFTSAEALARLTDSQFGMISPAVFIPAAERTGMIRQLGRVVIESVFRFISEHDLKQAGVSCIEINLSVDQCLQPELPDMIYGLQCKYGIDPAMINFEITETFMETIDNIMAQNLASLSKMGYTLSLDDYGVGYSNIRRVRSLPLLLIKIDKSMVDDMFTDDGSVVIRNTVDMMQGIHKKLVMEGVETKEELEALEKMNCDYIQGFYFSRPLPGDQFLAFVQEKNRDVL